MTADSSMETGNSIVVNSVPATESNPAASDITGNDVAVNNVAGSEVVDNDVAADPISTSAMVGRTTSVRRLKAVPRRKLAPSISKTKL